MAHQVAGLPWSGDGDVILRGIRAGTARSRVPRMPRRRIDRPLIKRLLRRAAGRRSLWWSVILIITYTFLLRMPSELFKQYRRGLLNLTGGKFQYGAIRRKHKVDWQFVPAFCVCDGNEALCLHTWVPVLDELEGIPGAARLGGYTPASWVSELRQLLAEEEVDKPEEWFGHDVRRGAAADVFAASGVDAMLIRSRWKSVGAAAPYVSRSEIDAGLLAQRVSENSDPEI